MAEHPTHGDMQAVIDAARKGHDMVVLDHSPHHQVIWTPAEGVQQVDLSQWQDAPRWKSGTVKVFDAPSFLQLIAENAEPGRTTVYVDKTPTAPKIVAVINGNGRAGPGFGQFKVAMEFRPTPQWTKWTSIDGKPMDQNTFAEFVEDNIADVASPTGADLVEIISTFFATKNVDFKSSIRLASGQIQFVHHEDIAAQVRGGTMEVPERFIIGLAPFIGTVPFKIEARFRYRLNGPKLSLFFKLERLDDVITKVLDEIEEQISELPEGCILVHGIAP